MHNTPPRPVVLIALDAAQGAALATLRQRYPSQQIRLDDSDAISASSLASNQVLLRWMRKTKDMGGRLHLIGLVSDGGVQSSLTHLLALLDIAKDARVRVVVHAVLDGVDVPAQSAPRYIAELEAKLDPGVGRIGTVCGRGFAMDVDGRWDRIEKVYRAMMADGVERFDSALHGIRAACAFGNPEAFVKPFIAFDYPGVSLVDSALHFNFAADGARELSRALAGADFDHFARKSARAPFAERFVCMTPYDNTLGLPTLFPRAPDPTSLLLDTLADAPCQQLHATTGSAASIASATVAGLQSARYGLVLADFADADNTTRPSAAAALDDAIKQILEAARPAASPVIVMAGRDAASAFQLIYVDDANPAVQLRDGGQLCDVASTLLELLQLPEAAQGPGASLLVRG